MEDYDLNGKITREAFEGMCESMQEELRTLISDCIESACLESVANIDFVEMIGGSSRVPWVSCCI